MNKEFVTYEIALALKELGFDGTPWFGNQASLYDVKGEHTMYTNYGVMYSGLSDGYISAPLKQQVFRWFREKYNQNSFIELVYQDRLKFDYVLYVNKKEEECKNYGDGPFNTYDEAENACIDKLIELAKQQDNG